MRGICFFEFYMLHNEHKVRITQLFFIFLIVWHAFCKESYEKTLETRALHALSLQT